MRQREALDRGLDMFEAVIAAAKLGVRVVELQDIAPGVADDAGYGNYYWASGFRHGIGTDIAELPNRHWKSETVLQAGRSSRSSQ